MPKYSFMDAPWTKAFRSFGRLLRTDPVLKATGATFRIWEGRPDDAEEPHQACCPFIRLTPTLVSSNHWVTEGMHEVQMGVTVEIATESSNIEDFLNFWWIVTRAVFPQSDDTERRFAANRLEADAGCAIQVTMSRPAFRVVYESSMLKGSGEFIITMHVPT